jgi:hypothetical protein
MNAEVIFDFDMWFNPKWVRRLRFPLLRREWGVEWVIRFGSDASWFQGFDQGTREVMKEV